jgi:hypothetical protein
VTCWNAYVAGTQMHGSRIAAAAFSRPRTTCMFVLSGIKAAAGQALVYESKTADPWFFSGAVRRKTMESATFQKWLAEQGCRFDTEQEKRGTGHAHVTVHREGRKAVVPLGGPHQILDARTVRRACEELGLEWSELPGPKSRV